MRKDQVVAGESSDSHEAGRSKRKLAGIAHQDVLPERHQGKHEPWNENGAQPVIIGDERQHHRRDQHDGDADAILTQRKNLRVLRVAGAELSGFSVEHETES